MIVHQPIITQHEGKACISCRIEIHQKAVTLPDTLWFRFPESCYDYIAQRSDGFAVAMLLNTMYFGEELEIRGVISPKLLYGLNEYQRIFNLWFPKQFNLVNISSENIAAASPGDVQDGVGVAFSGGVDSFYTLWSHLPQNQPLTNYQITHGLFLHGYDISLLDEQNFQLAYKAFAESLTHFDIEFLACQTNLHYFTEGHIKWHYAHGSVLHSSALLLGNLLSKFYIPASDTYNALIPWGTSPLTDHLISTETLQVIHHGAGIRRIDKLSAISDWNIAQKNLRVCTKEKKRHGVQNCSRCEKCLRTMTMLKVLDKLSLFTTFRQPFSNFDILRWAPVYVFYGRLPDQIINYARTNRKRGIIPFLWIVSLGGWLRYWILKLMPGWLFQRIKNIFYPQRKNAFLFSNLPTDDICKCRKVT
ncbi:MAG: hypothetical protein MUO76_05505 [Anaerolineaceae bacterium]|nr:hypothetical protein [Anaerolineaceae bacterium]